MRGRFMWRIGCAFALFAVLLAGLTGLLLNAALGTLGGSPSPAGTVVTGAIVILLLAMAARGVRRAARPVGDLIEAAGRVEAGDLAARVPERGPREVRALARAFNAMSGRLQSTEQERRRLLADVSHELRTPLTVIQGNLEGMLDGVYPMDAEHLSLALDETRMLERLIEDLRTLSIADAGALRLEREPTALAPLLTEVVAAFRASAEASNISLKLEVASGLPDALVDATRIKAVVGNLIANALRYTQARGSVSVRLAQSAGRQVVSVMDTGKGIEPAAVEHIFDRFYRSSDSTGSGLGLAIARSLIEAHGGEISAASTPGAGTTVTFTLPATT